MKYALDSRMDIRRDKKEKDKSSRSFNMTVESLENALTAAREDERKNMRNFMTSFYSACVGMVLHDKWGFGHDRLSKIFKQIDELYDGIISGYVSIDDIRKALLEETKLTF